MSKPSDKAAGGQGASRKVLGTNLRPPTVHAEFKEDIPHSSEHSKGRAQKRVANPEDRKNFRFILFALTIFIVIWIALELKQHHDAMTEFTPPTKESIDSR